MARGPLNVAFVLRRLATDGGTERYATELARWLVGRGHAVHVYCVEASLALPGVHVHPLVVRARRGVAGLLELVRAASSVPLDRHDVVQGFGRTLRHHVYRAGGGAHEAWLAARDRTRAARLLAAVSPRERLERWIDRRALTGAGLVVCNSEMAARDVRAWHGLPAERVRVVRNGVDSARFTPDPERRATARAAWRVPAGGRVALFFGSGFRRKGLATAARAFARVAGDRDRFVVIGRDARAAPRLRALRAELGDRLVAHGPDERPELWLPGADATVLPTRYDAAANTTLEAMACGVPAVTSARDGNAEIVPAAELVVSDPDDVEGFARALRFAWSGGADLGARCRAAAAGWPVSRNGEAMEALYEEWRRDG